MNELAPNYQYQQLTQESAVFTFYSVVYFY
jgi:hypothetical protein